MSVFVVFTQFIEDLEINKIKWRKKKGRKLKKRKEEKSSALESKKIKITEESKLILFNDLTVQKRRVKTRKKGHFFAKLESDSKDFYCR